MTLAPARELERFSFKPGGSYWGKDLELFGLEGRCISVLRSYATV